MFTGSGITGIDIDHCIVDGQLSTLAQEIVNKCKSYTEKSPSGTGFHISYENRSSPELHSVFAPYN